MTRTRLARLIPLFVIIISSRYCDAASRYISYLNNSSDYCVSFSDNDTSQSQAVFIDSGLATFRAGVKPGYRICLGPNQAIAFGGFRIPWQNDGAEITLYVGSTSSKHVIKEIGGNIVDDITTPSGTKQSTLRSSVGNQDRYYTLTVGNDGNAYISDGEFH